MMTRKQFGGKLLSAVAAGTLANFSLVAETKSDSLVTPLNAKCNDNGKSDQCHGAGAKTDTEKPEPPAPPDPEPPQPEPPKPPEPPACTAPAPDAEPACKADTCSQADAPTGNE